MDMSCGDYVLFLDDDQVADNNLIQHLDSTAKHYNADIVSGKVISKFARGVPEWVKSIYLYNRACPPTGEAVTDTGTANTLIKAKLLETIPGPFDPEYGLSGGEDTKLILQLINSGHEIISCQEAIVYELVQAERTTMKWMFKRAYRGGNSYARVKIETADKNRVASKLNEAFISTTKAIISAILSVLSFASTYRSRHWMLKCCSNLGRFSAVFGNYYREYKNS